MDHVESLLTKNFKKVETRVQIGVQCNAKINEWIALYELEFSVIIQNASMLFPLSCSHICYLLKTFFFLQTFQGFQVIIDGTSTA